MEKLEVGGISNSRPISWDSRLPLTGLYFNWTTKWLHEHLPEWKVTLDGYEEIDGHRCLRVLPAELEGETLWLDVEHDFLVRRYLSPSIPDRRQGRDFLVQEFRRLDTGIWFPVRGTTTTFRRIPDVYEWRVTSVTVNGEVNAAAWMPPRPEVGAFVSDLRTGMVRRVAHEGERTEIERKILEAAQKNLAARPLQSYQTQTSPISSALWWSMGLLGVAVVLLLAAKMFSKRSTYPARRNEA